MAITLKTVTDFLGDDASKLTDSDRKAIEKLVEQRRSIDPDRAGMLSGNTKAINKVIGPRTGRTVVFTKTREGSANGLPATKANLDKLTAERNEVPKWEPGRKAALTRQIKRITREMAKAEEAKKSDTAKS